MKSRIKLKKHSCYWIDCNSIKTTWKDLSDSMKVKICKKHSKFIPSAYRLGDKKIG